MFMLVRHKVKDFSQWKEVYDSHFLERARAGLAEKHLFTNVSDPHEVIILFEAREPDGARIFPGSPQLGEMLKQAGIVGQPDIYFLEDHGTMALVDEIRDLQRMDDVAADWSDREVTAEFVYPAPHAKNVFLAGTFNNWDTASLPMTKNKKGEWKATVKLLPGRYEYKYFLDGSWVVDDRCTEVVTDDKGEMNCVIDVAPKLAA